jgi:hypothetical protein
MCLKATRDGWVWSRDYPEYGVLNEVIVWNDAKYFVITVLQTVLFWNHYMGYEVQP